MPTRRPIDDIKDTFNLMINPRMVYILPIVTWTSISQVTYQSTFIALMTRSMENVDAPHPEFAGNEDMKNQAAMFAMVIRGIGDIFGA